MRTLDDITTAVRRAGPATIEELTLAVCAYDVLLSKLELDLDPVRLQEYFVAGSVSPEEYIGWCNDPRNPEFIAWHKAFIGVADNIGKEPDQCDVKS